MKYSLKINKADLLKIANDQHQQMIILVYLLILSIVFGVLL